MTGPKLRFLIRRRTEPAPGFACFLNQFTSLTVIGSYFSSSFQHLASTEIAKDGAGYPAGLPTMAVVQQRRVSGPKVARRLLHHATAGTRRQTSGSRRHRKRIRQSMPCAARQPWRRVCRARARKARATTTPQHSPVQGLRRSRNVSQRQLQGRHLVALYRDGVVEHLQSNAPPIKDTCRVASSRAAGR